MDKITILLSSTVFIQKKKNYLFQRSPEIRLNAYLTSIKQWLDNTSFNIVLVDNSGYTFEELNDYKIKYTNRFKIVSFTEENITVFSNFLKLPSTQELFYRSAVGRIDFKYGRIDGYDLNSLELKLNDYLQNEHSILIG